jgi:cytochrome P450
MVATTGTAAAAAPPEPQEFEEFRAGPRLANLRLLKSDPLTLFQSAKRRGDWVRCPLVPGFDLYIVFDPLALQDALLTNQPAFAKGDSVAWARRVLGTGLLTSDGDHHRRSRAMIQPSFHRQRLAEYSSVVAELSGDLVDEWAARDGDPVEMRFEMMRFALLVMGRMLFDADMSSQVSRLRTALLEGGDAVGQLMRSFSQFLPEWMPTRVNRRLDRAIDDLHEAVGAIIRERQASGEDRNDVLSELLSVQRDAPPDGRLTDAELLDEMLTLMVAGHETTGATMTWLWYALATNPEVERRVHAELDEVLGDRPVGFADLPSLKYSERVLQETLRLYSPVWIMPRQALDDVEVGGRPIPAGSFLITSPYLVQRDERWYEDPETFDPDRWLPERSAGRPRFSFFTFGAGNRLCVGQNFAKHEALMVLATVGRRFAPRLVEPAFRPEVLVQATLHPRALPMRLEPRG